MEGAGKRNVLRFVTQTHNLLLLGLFFVPDSRAQPSGHSLLPVQVVLSGDDRLLSTCFFLCNRRLGDPRIQKPEFLNGIKKVALSPEAGGRLDVMGFSG